MMLADAHAEGLKQSLQYFKGVGPRRAEILARLGLSNIENLLLHYPRLWEDRHETPPPGLPPENGPIVVRGRVVQARLVPTRMPLALYKATLRVPLWQGSIDAVWFKRLSRRYDVFQKLKSDIRPGADLWIIGRSQPTLLRIKEIQVDEYYRLEDEKSSLHADRLVPIYPSTEGISQPFLRELIAQGLSFADKAEDILPPGILRRRQLLASVQAFRSIHFPRNAAELEEARRRLAYEELLLLELAWNLKQRQTKSVNKNFTYEIKRTLLSPFRQQMGFDMTGAQKRVINEIFGDMQSPHPMTRLLQGDVGSGKTVVAIAALLLAVENGYQGAFMAPTEILAEQHFWTMSQFLRGLPIRVHLLTSRTAATSRRKILEALRSGDSDIVIGTHALLEGDVEFARLRLAVIDEQHRFGVRQRTTLRQKGALLDLLIMTATPIPRTLALALYGDLSISTLDEMPPGRTAVATHHGTEDDALKRVREEVAHGRQAYVVYPIISESSRLDLKAAKAEYERLKTGALAGIRVALIHGQMPGREKAEIMDAFVARKYDVLVATSVIEVGMDIPNATVMVIQNADRFGLASLHQLRGRVGRSGHVSECWLIADPQTPEARRRIKILCETSDGFRIGEEDLRLRGPGEILGTSQHGDATLRLADIFRDAPLQASARQDAQQILADDPQLLTDTNRLLRRRLVDLYQERWSTIDLA